MRTFLKVTMTSLLAGAVLCSPVLSQTAMAQTFGPESFPYATEAQTLQGQNEHKKAIKRLKKALKLEGLSAFETSTMYQMMGASYYARGKNEEAIEAYGNAINAGGLNATDKAKLQVNIAQLNIVDKNYALGAQQLEAYFQQGGVQKPTLLKMLLQAHMRAENKAAAVPWAEAMLRQGQIKTRKDHELAVYLFDTPEKRSSQMQVARAMIQQWPTDPAVIAQVTRLNAKAKRDGVPTVTIPGQ